MSIKKLCSRCGKVIDYGKRMCESCTKRQEEFNKKKYDSRKYNKTYNSSNRDKYSQDFYNSHVWRLARDKAKLRDKNICRLCYKEGKIVFADVVHHIEEVKKDKSKRYELTNLICLCHDCHNEVHRRYKRNASKLKKDLSDMAIEEI